jgi:mRNA interferase RelE/StbE
MKVRFDKSFNKAIDKIKDPSLLKRIESIIIKLELIDSIDKMTNTKKLIGYTTYYRIKLGDYRIGFELISSNEIRLITIIHRKDIYKKFP